MGSTFSGYQIAKSGIQAANAALQITGQNVSNLNTEGYTRQRVDVCAISSTANNMRYASSTELGIGGGVKMNGVSRLRDPYLDIRYRLENARSANASTQQDVLGDIENVLDEISTDGIDTQMKDLVTQLQLLSSRPGDLSTENIVKNSAMLLVKAFNRSADTLESIRTEQIDSFQANAIAEANNLLKNIAHLNGEIKSADIAGTPALELMDQRDSMLDELSKHFSLEISTHTVSVGSGRTVDELRVSILSGSEEVPLVSDDEYTQFSLKSQPDGTVDLPVTLQLRTAIGEDITPADPGFFTESGGTFAAYLTMLNDSGEYDGSSVRGIGYYQKMLDTMASAFAETMNSVNSTDSQDKSLFTAADGVSTDGITAAGLSISSAWQNSAESYITSTKQAGVPGVENANLGDNILYMVTQLSETRTFTTTGDDTGGVVLRGSLNTYLNDLSGVLALQVQDISRQQTSFNSTLSEISTMRDAVSSVDINEEGINMITYNQALAASSRFMTALDEAVDQIINRMGRVGL